MEYYSFLGSAITVLTAILVVSVDSRSISTRIFKARKARTNEYPFVTWIEYKGNLVCSGSLVAEEWVLTAAQCLEDPTLSEYQIVLGDTLVDNNNDGQLFYTPDTFFVHPGYDNNTLENDVALVRLPVAVNTSPKNLGVVPDLRDTSIDDIIQNKDTCVITGFGETAVGTPTKRKNKLTLRIVEDSECSGLSNYNDTNHICFRSKRQGSKAKACKGDEGAPIICTFNDVITQIGINSEGSCSNLLMAASDITVYLSWIQQLIDQYSYERCLNLPVITNGTYTPDGPLVVNATASLKCDSGLSRTSKNITITCQSGGNWTESLAACGCGNPPSASRGDFVPNGENAIGETATLTCDSGYDTVTSNVSELTITCQDTGDWTSVNASCVTNCGEPPALANGTYDIIGANFVDDTAIIRCDPGFVRSTRKDDKATITCKSNGKWSSTNIICLRTCGTVPAALNGTFETDSVDMVVGDTAVLACESGFLRSTTNDSEATISCESDGNWGTTSASCLRSCGAPSAPLNATFNLATSTLVNDTAVLSCDSGFLRSTTNDTEATIACEDDGQWTTTSAYCIQGCGNPTSVDNGMFESNGTNSVNDEATLKCNFGYVPSSTNQTDLTITCEPTGDWSTASASCLRTCYDPPSALNGSFIANSGLLVDDTAVLSCDVDYVRSTSNDSDATITCQSDGNWTSTSAFCIISCGGLPSVLNGTFETTSVDLAENDTAVLKCGSGFLRSVDQDYVATITCESSGNWSTTNATCQRSCSSLPSVSDGYFKMDAGYLVNDTAVFLCNQGFVRSITNDTDAMVTCESNGQWTSTSANCTRTCFNPPSALNGSFIANSGLLVDDMAVLSCDLGYIRSTTNDTEATITCQNDGNWTSTAANCIRTCGMLPTVLNGTFDTNSTDMLQDDTAVVRCDVGFLRSVTLDSDATITCESSGNWSITNALCQRTCLEPPAALNGTFVKDAGTLVNDTAVLSCDLGFLRSTAVDSEAEITCEDSGNWTSTSAVCIRSCGNLTSVENGEFESNGTNVVDDEATLTCISGYAPSSTVQSELTITCEDTGAWTVTNAVCLLTCGAPPSAANASFVANSTYFVNDTATLQCDLGYIRSTDDASMATITCEDSGNWSNTSAYCIRTCGAIPAVLNGTFASNSQQIAENDTAVLQCDSGFLRSTTNDSEATITCESSGVWSTISATCLRTCGEPQSAMNGSFVKDSGTLVDDTALLSCDYGFVRSSSNDSDATITCGSDGQWTTTSAYCIRTCFNPPSALNGSYIPESGLLVNDIAVLSCDAEYVRSTLNDTAATITCQSNGNWTTTSAYCIRACGDTPTVTNGVIGVNRTYIVNDTAELECNTGYTRSTAFTDEASVMCQENGNWTSTSAYCVESCSSSGTSFLFGFFKNVVDEGNPFLYGTVAQATDVQINIPRYNYQQTVSITKFLYVSIADELGGKDGETANKGIEITSTNPINLFLHHSRQNSAEGTVILPESCANKEHILITHDETSVTSLASSESVTVALEDNTNVAIVEHLTGVTVSAVLNRFQLLHHSAVDLTSTTVTADKNIMVFAGHRCANVPDSSIGRCDYLIEQIPPVTSLRRAYLLTYQKPRPHFSVRVVAPYDDTEVSFWHANGTLALNIQLASLESRFETFRDSVTISITSNKDILVAQYAHGSDSDNLNLGDPAYVIIPSLTQFLSEYNIALDSNLYSQDFLALIVKDDDDISGLQLAGSSLTTQTYESVFVPGVGNYKVLHEEIVGIANPALNAIVSHTNNTVLFGAIQYGFKERLGYALVAGRNTPIY